MWVASFILRRPIRGRTRSHHLSTQLSIPCVASLHLNLKNARVSDITISSHWQESCELEYEISGDQQLLVTGLDDGSSSTVLALPEGRLHEHVKMSLKVPEYLNLRIDAQHISLSQTSKIQGDFTLICDSGNVSIDKLRGSNLKIDSGTADITVKKLLEGNSIVKANSLIAKMVNGDFVDIATTESVEIEAMYSKYAHIAAQKNITLAMVHGYIKTEAATGNIHVNGLDGSFDLLSHNGDINIQINKLDTTKWISQAVASVGHIVVAVDPEVVASVQCKPVLSLELNGLCESPFATIVSDAFVGEEEKEEGKEEQVGRRIQVTTVTPATRAGSGTPSFSADNLAGHLSGKSKSVKRPRFQSEVAHSGKINLAGADEQSLATMKQNGREKGDVEGDLEGEGEGEEKHYDLKFMAGRSVRVETLSWIEIIRR